MLYNDFNLALRKGEEGEQAVADLLTANGFAVTDLTYNPQYYHIGDLLAEKNGRQFFIEVKTDTAAATTGNLVVEFVTNVARKKDGWFRVCTADKFAFYLEQTDEVILLDAAELREKYTAALKTTIYTTQYECNKYFKRGLIGLLEIDKLEQCCSSFRRIQLA